MSERPSAGRSTGESSLALTKRQRSHILFILTNARIGHERSFLSWYQGPYRDALQTIAGVLTVQHYERHEVDIDQGQHPPLPFQYLGFCEISIDGAPEAGSIIDTVTALHREERSAEQPATWLYYPVSEKVGRAPSRRPSMLTLAFANPFPGQDAEFREWYATRHIRHALNIPALVSGQSLERTLFQRPGALEARFHTIAVYEEEGTPESIIESFNSLPESTFHFPMLDLDRARFAEWVYRPLVANGESRW